MTISKKTPRKRGSKGEKPLPTGLSLQSKVYFLTFSGFSKVLDRSVTKEQIRDHLLAVPSDIKVKPTKYLVCQQMYDSGQPHFHAVLVYQKRKRVEDPRHYDYQGIHPNVQTMRNMKAALEYVYKEDPHPLTNMDIGRQKMVARAKDTSTLYQLLEQQMLRDPFNFDVDDYCANNGIYKQIYKADFRKALTLIRRAQPAYARKLLRQKSGIRLITPALISQRLDAEQIRQFYSHPCYQKIVDHINQIHRYPNRDIGTMAPSKTPHLLLVGDSSIGKSALVDHRPTGVYPYPGLMHYYACYHMSIGQKWFPPYRNFDYRLVRWNQFTIDSDLFPKSGYSRLLDYLEGAPSALPQKGRPPVQRQDNPKHIMTSNLTLEEQIDRTFGSEANRRLGRMNLGTRIDCVVIPSGRSIHFLRKLFVPPAGQ